MGAFQRAWEDFQRVSEGSVQRFHGFGGISGRFSDDFQWLYKGFQGRFSGLRRFLEELQRQRGL